MAKPGAKGPKPRRSRRIVGETDDRRRAAVKIPRGDDDLRLVGGDRQLVIAIAARRLDGGLDRLGAGVHDQAGVEPGKIREILVECAEIVGMKGARDDIEPFELALHRADETRMQMAEARRRIGAHHVDVALAPRRRRDARPARATGRPAAARNFGRRNGFPGRRNYAGTSKRP